jgi:hypothetical protein
LQHLLTDGGGGAGAPPSSHERTATGRREDGAGGAGLAEVVGGGVRGRLSAAEEAGAVEAVARCGRLGLWGDARAVYDACAPRAASLARLQAALLAQV